MAENRELALILKLVADQFQAELKKSQGLLGNFNQFLKSWQGQLTAVSGALLAVTKSTANYGEELLKASQKTGIAVESIAGLRHAANLADVDLGALEVGLKSLAQNMVEAASKTGDGQAAFGRIGVSATTASGQLRSTEAVLLEVAEAFAQSKDGAGKAQLAVQLFGKAGLDLIPFLNQGKSGITELMAEAQRLGLVMSKEDAEAASRFNDELKRLNAAMRGLTLEAGRPLIGSMTELVTVMRELASGPVGTMVSGFFTGLGEHLVRLSVLAKELAANWRFLFGAGKSSLSLDQLRAEIDKIEAEGKTRLFDMKHPGVLSPAGGSSSNGPTREIALIPEKGKDPGKKQEELGKALLEIYLAQNRAIDIGFEIEARRNAERLQNITETEAAQKRIDDAQGRIEEAKGRAQLTYDLSVRKSQQEERDGLIANRQAWLAYGEQVGASTEFVLTNRLELVKATLAKELEINQETADRVLIAWQNSDAAYLESFSERIGKSQQDIETSLLKADTAHKAATEAAGGFAAGWAKGMKQYLSDNNSMLNMAVDMARRTAQLMEQSFRTFFFDAMKGRIQSLQDVLQALSDFVAQLASQILAQLATQQVLRGLNALNGLDWSSLFGGGGGGAAGTLDAGTPGGGGTALAARGGFVHPRRFAFGGPVFTNGDSVPALLTPGEFVVNPRGVEALQRINQGDANGFRPRMERPIVVNMTVHTPDVSNFRRSQGQILAEARMAMARAGRNL